MVERKDHVAQIEEDDFYRGLIHFLSADFTKNGSAPIDWGRIKLSAIPTYRQAGMPTLPIYEMGLRGIKYSAMARLRPGIVYSFG
jgi:hypothetical protein